jgi:hypothetical protein
MAIPKPIRPEYGTTIPSSGKKIKYQPFSVKEEKVLILAAESEDQEEITNAITNVLKNCVTSPQDFKVDDLALFDIEYLFLKTRSKSAGEKIKLQVTDPDDETYSVSHEINIDRIKVEFDEDHKDVIELSEGISVKMKYPDISFFSEGVDVSNLSGTTKTVSRCISQIISGDEVYNKADITDAEMDDWMDGLTTEQFEKLAKFFQTMPQLKHEFTLKNKKTGNDFTIKLQGLADFF